MSQNNTPPGGSAGIAVFILAVFLSAFLLFQVQPVIARHVLPWYGGSPSVWSACMLFFQVGLVAGYAYAHLLVSALRGRRGIQIGIHCVLMAVAVLTLPIIPDASLKPASGDTDPIPGIIMLLARTVGLPYVILSASGPLVQHWFSRAYPARSPYRLYSVSNLGSLIALLSYPFLFEVHLTVRNQSFFWSIGFVLYALVLCCTAYVFLRAGNAASGAGNAAVFFRAAAEAQAPPGPTRYLRWILFSACGSVLLLAVTNQICQDVAVVPFLWILPLCLYLLSFIIAFDHPRWYSRLLVIPAAAVFVGLSIVLLNRGFGSVKWPIVWQIAIFCGGLFLSCLACHGEIVRLKPIPAFLTHFYLAISVGGALGGIFVNLAAPAIFDSYYELHIGFLLLAALLSWQLLPRFTGLCRRRPETGGKRSGAGLALAGAGGLLWCLALLAMAAGLHANIREAREGIISSQRSFFGVLKVKESRAPTGQVYRTLIHGQIHHGLQYTEPELRAIPTTYFARQSGIGSTFEFIPQRYGWRNDPLHVGVVGLGIGTLAAYAQPGDRFRFYEINQQVIDVANSHFKYLEDCRGRVANVLGDGRISLERELAEGGGNRFDILVIDAFSGDSIPMHLLTAEAFDLYLEHLKENGVLAFHITNKHVDLADPLRIHARRHGLEALRLGSNPRNGIGSAAEWVIITRDRALADRLLAANRVHYWKRGTPAEILWTDDFGNLFRALK